MFSTLITTNNIKLTDTNQTAILLDVYFTAAAPNKHSQLFSHTIPFYVNDDSHKIFNEEK